MKDTKSNQEHQPFSMQSGRGDHMKRGQIFYGITSGFVSGPGPVKNIADDERRSKQTIRTRPGPRRDAFGSSQMRWSSHRQLTVYSHGGEPAFDAVQANPFELVYV